jgi:hypothetical protein
MKLQIKRFAVRHLLKFDKLMLETTSCKLRIPPDYECAVALKSICLNKGLSTAIGLETTGAAAKWLDINPAPPRDKTLLIH